jgi:GNAT superfamily N-acetyltransferase
MDSTASIYIRKMIVADLPFCNSLVTEAGWNQIAADWLRAMALEPAGCWMAEWDGVPVATTTSCIFGKVGWIAMVLVKGQARGQGIARHLLRHAIAYLEQKGVTTIRLDATPPGREVYSKLGFEDEYLLVRYAGIVTKTRNPNDLAPIPAGPGETDDLLVLDAKVTGTPRESLLREMLHTGSAPFFYTKDTDGMFTGYAGYRRGREAVQIGPAIAKIPGAGRPLVDAVFSLFYEKKIFIDIPLENRNAIKWAENAGLTEQRRFTRMCKGLRISDNPAFIWASFGPEKG